MKKFGPGYKPKYRAMKKAYNMMNAEQRRHFTTSIV